MRFIKISWLSEQGFARLVGDLAVWLVFMLVVWFVVDVDPNTSTNNPSWGDLFGMIVQMIAFLLGLFIIVVRLIEGRYGNEYDK